MKKFLVRALWALCVVASVAPVFGYLPEPGDPAATSEARNLYRYLATRKDQTLNKMVEGQHLGGVTEIQVPGQFEIKPYAIDGRLPGFVGSRYDGPDQNLPNSPYVLTAQFCTDINTKLKSIWDEYQPIIQITATPRNPWDPALGRAPRSTPDNITELFDPSAPNPTIPHQNFWNDIDLIATALQELQAHGIPVIFRPFAEFNQSNKYYFEGQQYGDFVTLWRQVRDYYVGKGLHNLLFCWEVWALDIGNHYAAMAQCYPGDGYVDVVAGAYYFLTTIPYVDGAGNFSFPANKPNDGTVFTFLNTQNRPFGAAQFGVNYQAPGGAPGTHDLTISFMNYVHNGTVPNTMAFAYYWKGYMSVEKQLKRSEFVANPAIATVDDLPDLSNSVASVTLGNLNQTYDGTPKPVTVTTAPSGLNVITTYNGSTTPPTEAGTYAVVATVNDPYYTGSATDTLIILRTDTFISIGAEDGWLRESAPGSGLGGSKGPNNTSPSALRIGDSNTNCQYKLLVSFDTQSLPTNPTIVSATLKLKRGTLVGANFFLTSTCYAEISNGGFGGDPTLVNGDFQATATAGPVATMSAPPGDNTFSTGTLNAAGIAAISTTGRTQLRLYFTTITSGLDTDDYVGFYGGDDAVVANRPVLEITYR